MQPPEIPASEWALALAELAVCLAFLGAFVFVILRTAHLKGERGNRLRLLAGFLLLAPMFQPNGETWLVPFVKGVYATGLLALIWIYRTGEDRGRLIAKWAISLALIVPAGFAAPAMGPYVPFLAVVVGFGVSLIWAPNIAALLSRPLTDVFDGGDEPDNRPVYSSAQAQRFQGHYDKSMELAREQLVHFPGDFDGQMLIAAVQAENLNDLASATATIEETLSQSGREPHQISYALNTLADWQIKAGDPTTAQATLERLVAMFPDTELAQQTVQRLSRLATAAPREKRAGVVMPEFERDLGLRGMKNAVKPPAEETPEQQAARYVARLEKYPTDWEAREQL
ncbi:MAG: hypothetical protein HY300_18870, partial [Verrucomicrobia bacterium]|nr:hypothetical protein [Verrucomicrobiota bacterium]